MIDINLIVRERPRVDWRRVGVTAAAGAVLMGFGLYGLTWWTEYRRVRQELADLGPLAETYRTAIASGEHLAEQSQALTRQEQQLARIGRNQAPNGQAAVLQKVLAAAPADVTVTAAAFDVAKGLQLTGQATDFAAAMRYLQTLQGLPILTTVEARKVTTVTQGLTTFTFAANVRREGAE